MAEVKDKQTIGAPFGNAEEIVRVVYDFSKDAGAVGALDILETLDDIVITEFYARGITVLDSAADGASIDVGISGGDTDVLLDGVAEATFAADALIKPTTVEGEPNVLALPLKLAANGKIIQTIVAEALTSGKCEYFFKYHRFGLASE
jgi:hypothetical protein